MKRLIALSRSTLEFHLNTQEELNFIQQNNSKLTEDKLAKYYDSKEMASWGSLFYTHHDETIEFYVAEAFGFVDVDKTSENQSDYTAIVVSKIDENNKPVGNMYYFEFPNVAVKDSQNKTLIVNGNGLLKLNAMNIDDAKMELAQQFDLENVKFA